MVFGVGISDIYTMRERVGSRRRNSPLYVTWQGMLARCYSEKFQARHPSYIGCTVCAEWHRLSVFKEWYDEHHREGFDLDKDLKSPGNSLYSPEKCLMLPKALNRMLCGERRPEGMWARGTFKIGNMFRAHVGRRGKQCYAGTFNTQEEAVARYREVRAADILKVANSLVASGELSADVLLYVENYTNLVRTGDL